MSISHEVNINGRTIKFEFQKFARQANGSVMVSSGDTQVLVTVCAADKASPGLDFFPLGVDYIEKTYAAGRVPGGYFKREGKPSDKAALTARLIDRPLRPLFPKAFKNETVITATVLSYEHGHNPGPLALVGASTALMISDIPFAGPVAALNIGRKEGQLMVDPLEGEAGEGDLFLTVACSPDAVLMVEAGANEASEKEMLDAIQFAHNEMRPFFEFQKKIQQEIGKAKMSVPEMQTDTELQTKVRELIQGPLNDALGISDKQERSKAISKVTQDAITQLNPENDSAREQAISQLAGKLRSELMRTMILRDKRRIDGRGLAQIRPIKCETGILSRPHGSSLFTRGETQALASVTLAAAEDQQRLESLWDTEIKDRFMLHYNFPPFSVGEARMQRTPSRREIGHGSLARRALYPMVPSENDFAYTIRLVSEILESNGSSSMATVCAGTMALLKAGVPLKDSVAGIAMGLVKEGEQSAILSDILGDEDHVGDMDFKVCGTKKGITALQMDIKIGGISPELMMQALEQAREGRLHILGKMAEAIAEPQDLSSLAPRMFKLKIGSDKIKDLIGPGGKNIKKISSEAGVKMDIGDNGVVTIVAPDSLSAQAAKTLIRAYTTTPQVGEVYLGRVVRVVDFGAFIELRPGVDGLCHISHMDDKRIESIEDAVKLGDEVLVKVIDIDRQGRIKLSRRDAFGMKPTFS
ncbi:MAG: polyribonucleotide nucleotidyltransferase [Deltaproteobacteria bacterium]|nr:polyribonucleotide nucleotidyltransferase [Deltaproteobacteria bacterium]